MIFIVIAVFNPNGQAAPGRFGRAKSHCKFAKASSFCIFMSKINNKPKVSVYCRIITKKLAKHEHTFEAKIS